MQQQLKKTLAALTLAATGLVMAASAAGAINKDPGEPPPPPPSASKPNLQFSAASVQPLGTSWEITYTVKNAGTAIAPSFHVAVRQNGANLLKDSTHASLAAGASRTETVAVSQTSCYLPVQLTADSTNVVAESKETDNVRWAVGLTSKSCASLPKYKVKATSFTAVRETHANLPGSDEPYWIFNSIGVDGTIRSSASQIFGDVDTGESRNFSTSEGCLYLSCTGGAAPFGIGFSTQLFEHDLGDTSKTLATIADYFDKAGGIANLLGAPSWVGSALGYIGRGLDVVSGWAEDDLIGSNTYAFDPAYLASRLTTAGGSFDDTRYYMGADSSGGGIYTMVVRVTRTA